MLPRQVDFKRTHCEQEYVRRVTGRVTMRQGLRVFDITSNAQPVAKHRRACLQYYHLHQITLVEYHGDQYRLEGHFRLSPNVIPQIPYDT